MSATLLIIVLVVYLGVAASEFFKGNYGMSLAFFSYSLANLGFIMAMK